MCGSLQYVQIKFVWNVSLLTYTNIIVTPTPAQMGNVLVFVMTLFVPVIETGLVENAIKKVKHVSYLISMRV